MSKKAVFVGRDVAPSDCFKRLELILKDRGFDVDLFVGERMMLTETIHEMVHAVSHADIVVLGMSSSSELAQSELIAGRAARSAKVPYGFYGDVPHCWARARRNAWFHELADDAVFYFGVTQADADAAREVFQGAQLIGTGNPLREEMAFPRLTREEVRSMLNVTPEEKVVLVPGGKFAAGNMALLVIVMDALSLLSKKGQHFQLVFAAHPGDRIPHAVDIFTQKEMKLYEELVSFSPIPTRIADTELIAAPDMIPGADIIVEFGSSIGIGGAYQGIPIVNLGFEVWFHRLEQISGERALQAVTEGIAELVVADASKLADSIQHLLTADGFARMRTRQQELYPKPMMRGAALHKIADALAKIV